MRRLNKVPQIAGAALLLVAVTGFSYSFYKRLQGPVTVAPKETKRDPKPGDGTDLASTFTRSGLSTSPASTKPSAAPKPGEVTAAETPHFTSTSTTSSRDVVTEARTEAWKVYYTQIAEIQKARYDHAREAMDADMTAADKTGRGGSSNSFDTSSQGGGSSTAVAMAGQGVAGGAAGSSGFGGGTLGSGGTDVAAQNEKQRFQSQHGDTLGLNEDLAAVKHNAKPNTIMEGTPISATTIIGSTSDMPGMVKASVDQTVCDGMTGQIPLIPQGSILIGKSDNSVSAGQTREGVIWQRALLPDTSSIQLGSMEGADQAGYAGEHDQVDTHWAEKFLSATVISIGGALAQIAQPQQSAFSGYSPSSVAAGSLTQQYSQLGQAYAQAGLSVPNTLIIRPGYRIAVLVNKDILLPPYVDQRDPSEGLSSGCGIP